MAILAGIFPNYILIALVLGREHWSFMVSWELYLAMWQA